MYRFPNEVDNSSAIQVKLDPAFELAEAAFNFWLEAEKDRWLYKSKLPLLTIQMAMMLDVQMLRFFRSVIEVCRRGEGFCGRVLSRSLFETVLGVAFLLFNRVKIIVETNGTKHQAKAWSGGKKPGPKDNLSKKLRASLYYAKSVIESHERAITDLTRQPGQKRIANRLRKMVDTSNIAESDKRIGPKWAFILRNRPYTYSGLSIKNLAKVLHTRLYAWYEAMYASQSLAAHGTEPLKHLDTRDGDIGRPRFQSDVAEVYGALHTATIMFLVHLTLMQKYIGFGPDLEIALASLRRKMNCLQLSQEIKV